MASNYQGAIRFGLSLFSANKSSVEESKSIIIIMVFISVLMSVSGSDVVGVTDSDVEKAIEHYSKALELDDEGERARKRCVRFLLLLCCSVMGSSLSNLLVFKYFA